MNKTLAISTTKFSTYTQQLAHTQFFPIFQEMLSDNQTYTDALSVPFTIYEHHLLTTPSQSVRWLWEKRLPLSGITLLDGDHDCGKSLLSLQIAAAVSSGTPMPDGSPTIQGGVVIVSTDTDARTTQLQMLTALGADLSCVEILSFIREPVPEF